MPTRTLELGTDLRDVLVRGDQLFVTRFRAAELLVLNRDGVVAGDAHARKLRARRRARAHHGKPDSTCIAA